MNKSKGEALVSISAKETKERSVKWKFTKLCNTKLPSDITLKSSVKSTMCVFFFSDEEVQSPIS